MGRSRYTITEPDKPHFLTYTVVEWLPVFTRPETVQILLDCWQYQQQQGLRLYGYVVLENHCHVILHGEALDKQVARFKSYTARKIYIVPTLCVGMHPGTLSVKRQSAQNASRHDGSHAERGSHNKGRGNNNK